MADSPLEELEAHHHAEHAAHGAHDADPLISRVTLTIAIMAVLAAVGGTLETTEGDETIVAKNEAVLQQNQASDAWSFFQAKSIKKNLYALAAEQNGPKAADYAKTAAQNGADQADISKKAKAFEEARDHWSEQAEVHERRHGRLTVASTLLHMAIAIATLAIILKRKWPWGTAMALTATGVMLAVWAYF